MNECKSMHGMSNIKIGKLKLIKYFILFFGAAFGHADCRG